MSGLRHDLVHGLRRLSREPVFALSAVVCLAIGIGVNTMIFSLTNAILLRPLPFENRDRLVVLDGVPPTGQEWLGTDLSGPTYLDIKESARSYERIGALTFRWASVIGADGEPERVETLLVTPEVVSLVGETPIALGRRFTVEEGRAARDDVAMISHGLWQRRFGADPGILGEPIVIDGRPYTVVGVMSPHLGFLESFGEAVLPLTESDLRRRPRSDRSLVPVGLLEPGVTVEEARAEADSLARRLAESYPESESGWGIQVRSMARELIEDFEQAVLILHGAVGLVLLIACANVANLILARSGGRAREMGVRAALGAGRLRMVRQLLVESLLLGLVGGGAGLLLAVWGLQLLLSISPAEVPRLADSAIDGNVLLFTAAVAVATAVVFGLAPALHLARGAVQSSLRSRRPEARGGQRLLGLVVVGEIALASILLVGAGLVLGSLLELQDIDPGFDPDRAFYVSVDLPRSRYADAPSQARFFEEALEKMAEIPGVESVGATDGLPLAPGGRVRAFELADRPVTRRTEARVSAYRSITEGYLETMKIPLSRGRAFTSADDAAAVPVALVNATMARRFWGGDDPVGATVLVPVGEAGEEPVERRIVGVIGDVKVGGLGLEVRPTLYVPYRQDPVPAMSLVTRSAEPSGALADRLLRAVRLVDPQVGTSPVRAFEELVAENLLFERFSSQVLAVFAGTALLLATLGIYGVMLFSVSRRTQEIAVRLALGASPGALVQSVLARAALLVGAGLGLGLLGSFVVARFLGGLLHGVSAGDPATYLAVALLLALTALGAAYVPARRALRVDPASVLRYE